VRTLTLAIVTFNVTFGAAWSVLVLYATQRLGLGAVGFGLLTTVSALGGLAGGILAGQAIGGVVAQLWGVTAPFWFAFVGSAIILTLIWRQLGHIAHAESSSAP
jgi:hypothetical protein